MTPITRPLELWAGVECTVNRVRDQYFSQLERNGHAERLDDLDRIAAMGVRALRYPVIWERTAPQGLEHADWRWADERLGRLRELGIAPIAGLIHHGSGPEHTSLVSPCFADKLAQYAAAVAQRYPWMEYYTPVNEPLTTARFSALYGVWYPHARDPRLFKDALLNQCRAVVLSMREIRRINPAAKLVQTDDLGKYYGTPLLAYQVEHNNAMRWLSWDLLFGRVARGHALWDWLRGTCQASEEELSWFAENPCPPDIVGGNYYVTSERFIDEKLENYPERYHGGNGRHRYADLETARCIAHPTGGLRGLLLEAWERYRAPLAVTEIQLDASRDDQLRWVAEQWRGIEEARESGADVRAFTAWALFGSFDWNCLVSECRGYYEPGAFDVRAGGKPRPTAVARLLKDLGEGTGRVHPVLQGPGWWRRADRLYAPPVHLPKSMATEKLFGKAQPILITGATGTLGMAFSRACERRGLEYRLLRRGDLDIADADSVAAALDAHTPWAVVNAAGYVRVDDAERDAERCFRENTFGAERMAQACARAGIPLITFSSDLVFDGLKRSPYDETDPVSPLNVYGRSKAQAEKLVLARHPGSLVVRTSAFFGPWDQHNFITLALRAFSSGMPFVAAHDQTVSPTYVPDLVNACLDLLIDGESGVWHLTNGTPLTWAELARAAARVAAVDPAALQEASSAQLGFAAARPPYSALGSVKCALMPTLDDALARYCHERQRPESRV